MISKHCSWCDHQFKTKLNYQIYCSAECREAATKEKIMQNYVQKRTQQRAKKKRYCTSCNTLLSMYNDATTCQACDVDNSAVSKILKDMKGLSNGKD
jgi:hypothetical protein